MSPPFVKYYPGCGQECSDLICESSLEQVVERISIREEEVVVGKGEREGEGRLNRVGGQKSSSSQSLSEISLEISIFERASIAEDKYHFPQSFQYSHMPKKTKGGKTKGGRKGIPP